MSGKRKAERAAARWKRVLFAGLVSVTVILLTVLFGEHYGRLMASVFEAVMPMYWRMDVFEVSLVHPMSEWGYRLLATNTESIYIGRHFLPAGQELSAHALLSHSLLRVIFLVSVIAGASVSYRFDIRRLFIQGICCLLLLELIDIPLTLAGSVEEVLLMNFNRPGLEDSWLVGWMSFLSNGGRLGLTLIGAWLVVLGSRRSAA